MTIVDTSVWIDYFNGIKSRETDLLDTLLGSEPIGVGDLIYMEVLQGFKSDTHFQRGKQLLDMLVFFEFGGKEIALKSARNYRFLRKKGITVRKTIDAIIATFCIEQDFQLLHCDKDFAPFATYLGLKMR